MVRPRIEANWLTGLVMLLFLFGTLACRVEVGLGEAAAARVAPQATLTIITNELPLPLPASPSPFLTEADSDLPTPVPPTATPTPTTAPVVTTVPATPTPPPIVPAQAPPARIMIPRINLDAPVEVVGWSVVKQGATETSAWTIPDHAAGWHQNSAWPGHGGNIVLSGHHNLGGEVFRDLVKLQKGDEIILQADGRDYRYGVADHFILPERGVPEEQRQQNAQWIMPTTDERLTLVTCWPYNDNSHRLIVVAK